MGAEITALFSALGMFGKKDKSRKEAGERIVTASGTSNCESLGECSVCGGTMPEKSSYCPHCGCKVEEDGGHHEWSRKEKVKSCPFCSKNAARLVKDIDEMYVVECQACGASSPFSPRPELAVKAWNRREGRVDVESLRKLADRLQEEADWGDPVGPRCLSSYSRTIKKALPNTISEPDADDSL